MPMKYPEEFIIQTVKQHEAGVPIKELSQSLNVASSTLYHWVKAYKTIPRKKGEYTPAGYQRLLDHKSKLERQLEVIHLSGCINLIPSHQRLFVLEDIHENHPDYSIYELCEALEVSRGTFYNHIKRRVDRTQKEAENEKLKLRIREIFNESRQTYGAEKIRAALLKEEIHMSNKRVSADMKEMGLESVRTDAKKQYELRRKRDKENIVKRKFTTDRPNKIWVSDFTYFEVEGRWMYLCVGPLREFCVSDFRQNQEYHVFNVQNEGLFPLVTPVPEGWDGMRAVCGVNAGAACRESYFKGISPPSGRRT